MKRSPLKARLRVKEPLNGYNLHLVRATPQPQCEQHLMLLSMEQKLWVHKCGILVFCCGHNECSSQHRGFIFMRLWKSEVWSQSHWIKSKVPQGWFLLEAVRGQWSSPSFAASSGCLYSLTQGPSFHVRSASLHSLLPLESRVGKISLTSLQTRRSPE